MSDEELETALAERFNDYAAGMRLPEAAKSRFVGVVRRRRAVRRMWTVGLIGVLVVACIGLAAIGRRTAVRGAAPVALVAGGGATNDTAEVSYWMLLGSLRECFGRSRSSRRKEEE